jgi:DNA-3-methyladenine glycosylase II
LTEVMNDGSVDAPSLRFRVLGNDPTADAVSVAQATLRRLLGLDVDPRPLGQVLAARRRWRGLAMTLRGLRPPRFTGLFETFANVIPFQQVSLDAGVAVVRRLVERFGDRILDDGTPAWAFPRADAIANARISTLRRCGMSGRKAETLRHAARLIVAGEVSEAKLSLLGSEDAARDLTALPGIGPWSAALILLRGLGRLDVFPPGDVGAERGLREVLGLSSAHAAARAITQAGPRRGYLYFFALGGSFAATGLIRGAPRSSDKSPDGPSEHLGTQHDGPASDAP